MIDRRPNNNSRSSKRNNVGDDLSSGRKQIEFVKNWISLSLIGAHFAFSLRPSGPNDNSGKIQKEPDCYSICPASNVFWSLSVHHLFVDEYSVVFYTRLF